jgi:hypothetical protein
MKLPFSALAHPGPDAMAIAAARLPGADQRSVRAMGTNGTHLSSKGIQAVFFAPENAGTLAADKVKPAGRA